jgi:hypothetical protein
MNRLDCGLHDRQALTLWCDAESYLTFERKPMKEEQC